MNVAKFMSMFKYFLIGIAISGLLIVISGAIYLWGLVNSYKRIDEKDWRIDIAPGLVMLGGYMFLLSWGLLLMNTGILGQIRKMLGG